MSRIKLIATDLDGTLLGADHTTIPAENLDALQRAGEAGIMVTIATGRTRSMLDGILAQAPFIPYAIMSNGALIMDLRSGEAVYHDDMSVESSGQLVMFLNHYLPANLYYEAYIGGKVYMEKSRFNEWLKHDETPHFLTKLLNPEQSHALELVDDLAAVCRGKPIEKINVDFSPDCPKVRYEVLARLRTMGAYSMTSSLNGNLELNGPEVNKGTALRALADKLGLPLADAVAFGDSSNDTEMLEAVGHSYAMANAGEFTKKRAKFEAPSNTDAGVGKVVNQYLAE
jgi:Cof subfamily protein (haloacid dehalogenase superfamily)